MTKEQLVVMAEALKMLQQHLDERTETLNKMAKDLSQKGSAEGHLMFSIHSEIYNALSLVNTVHMGAYQGMLVMMNKKEQNNEA